MIDELYDLIGGNRTVWAATDAFYRRVLADEAIRPFFETTDMAQLRARQSMFISMLLGGRVVYTGKDITSAHKHARGKMYTSNETPQGTCPFQEPAIPIPDDWAWPPLTILPVRS